MERRHVTIAALVAGVLTATANAQAPVLDGAAAPARPATPRPTPRGLDIPGLYTPFNRTETSRLDAARLKAEDAATTNLGPLRMGVLVEFAPVRGESSGQWTPLEGGDAGWLWTATFQAPGSQGIRLRIPGWSPPNGAELLVYDAADPSEVMGPFTNELRPSSGTLWTPTVYGEEVRLEYFLPPPLEPTDPSLEIVVDGLIDQYRVPGGGSTGGNYQGLLSCHLDATCYSSWADAADSVGALSFVSGPYSFFCSGAMLNRTAVDFTPLFMTARHCGVTESNEDSVLVTWEWESTSCGGSPPGVTTLVQTMGQAVLVNDAATDYTLVGLAGFVNTYYVGWDANYWSSGSATGIHHPDGSWKRITFGSKTGDVTSCVGGTSYLVSIPNGNGEIEPGSSGSPIFDSMRRVRGTASCASWSCSSANSASYGRFDSAWPELAPYLAPTDPVYCSASAGPGGSGTIGDPIDRALDGTYAVIQGSDLVLSAGIYDSEFTTSKAMTIHSLGGSAVIR